MPIPSLPLSAIPHPAFLWDAGGRIAAANASADALVGRSPAGCSAGELLRIMGGRHPDGTRLTAADLPARRALAGEEAVDVPLVVTSADGRMVAIRASSSPLRDGETVVGALEIWIDVGAGRLQEEFAESEAKYRNLVELSPDAILIHQDGVIVFANPAASTLFGAAAPRDLLGRPVLDLVRPAQRADVEWNIAADLRGEESPLTTVDVIRPDGTTVPVQGRGAMVPFRGRPAVQVILRDVTDQNRAEEQVRRSARRRAFLLALGDRLRAAGDIAAITRTASEMLGHHLGANGVVYCEIDESGECATVRADWTDGTVPPITGSYRMDDFGIGDIYRAGLVRVTGDPGDGGPAAHEHVALAIRASLGVPVCRGERLAAVMAVHSAVPRTWTDDEVELVRQTGDRVWASVEHGRVEEALRESEERLRLAQESARIGIWDHDIATDTVRISPEFLRHYDLDDLAVSAYDDLVPLMHPEDRAMVEAAREAAFGGGMPLDLELRVILPAGGCRWIQFKGRAVVDGPGVVVRVIGLLIDVTERKGAEIALARYAAKLRASQDQLRDVIDATGAGFFLVSLDPGQCTISPRGAEILGFGTAVMPSLLQIVAEAQARMHPDDLARVIGAFMTFVETESERTEVEFRVRTLEGGWRWVQAISTSAERDAAGRVTAIAGFLFDIDERKRAEQALRRSNEELERFAYVASHDLQEPLRSIISFSQLLERRYTGQLDADADEFIAFIVDGGTRMQRLILDLLQLSRIETGARPLEPTDMAGIVEGVARAMETMLQEAGATLEVGDLPGATADAAQIEQVVSNLISNAIKYRREGVPPRVRIAGRRMGSMVEFAVTDNGIGIEPEYHDGIFDMFRRLHTHDQYDGTGIGLAVVKRIVERHGGRVRVESVPGEGSTFFFTLPAA